MPYFDVNLVSSHFSQPHWMHQNTVPFSSRQLQISAQTFNPTSQSFLQGNTGWFHLSQVLDAWGFLTWSIEQNS